MGRKVLAAIDILRSVLSPDFRVLCLFISLLILVGCGENENKIRVGVIIPETSHPDFRLLKLALDENAGKYNARIIHQQVGLLELLDKGIDILILNCPEPRDRASAVVQTHRRGIPVVMLDCPPPEDLHVEVYIKVNDFDAGKMSAEYVVDKLDGKGNVIVLEGPRNDEAARQITLGMYSVLEQHESIRIVASERHPNWSRKLAAETVRSELNKYAGNIQAVLAGNSDLAMGAFQAVSEQRLAGNIITAGIGADLAACQSIIRGAHDAEVDRMPYERGLEALKLATAIAKDEEFPYDAEIREEDPKIKVRYGPLRLITRENVSVMNRMWPELADKR